MKVEIGYPSVSAAGTKDSLDELLQAIKDCILRMYEDGTFTKEGLHIYVMEHEVYHSFGID